MEIIEIDFFLTFRRGDTFSAPFLFPSTLGILQLKGLVTNYGEGGHVKFYPYEKGGGGKRFSHAEGGAQPRGHNKFWGSFYVVA